ncbi:MAG: membrane-bound O-acyltransferase family protein, partial [Myxococcales bacterium]|nr:membrane-bound O-acyltransferase family protein [Myxococcales bacterium]
MVFASLFFIYVFLPVQLLLYFSTRSHRIRNLSLLSMSLLFYSWGEPIYISLLLLSGTVDFLLGMYIEDNAGTSKAKRGLTASMVFNLSLLGVFKYYDFFLDAINQAASTNLPLAHIALPLGISFFTFQTMSYTIDVYRGDVKASRSYLDFLTFVTLFHQLVAGPIVRFRDLSDRIRERTVESNEFLDGVHRFCVGLAKKVVFANTAGALVESVMGGQFTDVSFGTAWLVAVLYGFQIYFDFSGYSDMAIGLGKMAGFRYLENFRHPFMASSVREFWRRWHISLMTFFRDYLYIPLGGNRHHWLRNIFIVWALTGLWHGASWNYVIWGLYFGVVMIVEVTILKRPLERSPRWLMHLYLWVIMTLSWPTLFYEDLGQMIAYFQTMFTVGG